MRTPNHWSNPDSPLGLLLAPLGRLYGLATWLRLASGSGWKAPVPVICIGNVSAGGTGKTPTAIAVARLLGDLGIEAHFVTKGYGGRLTGPVRVDLEVHRAPDTGDEPLLLARTAPTWIARSRVAGAKAAIQDGAKAIILDDGFQDPSLIQDASLLVVDGAVGFGNRRLIPAGPLREPIKAALARAFGVVIVGNDQAQVGKTVHDLRPGLPILKTRLVPPADRASAVVGKAVVAFAGIGRPEKFFDTLRDLGADVKRALPFADHHPFSAADLSMIRATAERHHASIVTTEKDLVRLPPEWRDRITALPVELSWDDPAQAKRLFAFLAGE